MVNLLNKIKGLYNTTIFNIVYKKVTFNITFKYIIIYNITVTRLILFYSIYWGCKFALVMKIIMYVFFYIKLPFWCYCGSLFLLLFTPIIVDLYFDIYPKSIRLNPHYIEFILIYPEYLTRFKLNHLMRQSDLVPTNIWVFISQKLLNKTKSESIILESLINLNPMKIDINHILNTCQYWDQELKNKYLQSPQLISLTNWFKLIKLNKNFTKIEVDSILTSFTSISTLTKKFFFLLIYFYIKK